MSNVITSPPVTIKEEVLAVRGGWVIKGRIVVYHNKIRRPELFIEKSDVGFQDVGWSIDDIQQLADLLVAFAQRNNEPLKP